MTPEIKEFFHQIPFWNRLSHTEKKQIEDYARIIRYRQGESVHSGEINCLGALFIQSGILRVYLLSDEGKEVTMYRLKSGDTCVLSASCMLSAITFDVQIDAETDCELLLIPSSVFSSLMQNNIYVENYIYRLTAERFSDVITAVQRMFFMTLEQRIAAFLIDESASSGALSLALTQEQLARSIGSAREAVSRQLKQMAKDNLLEVSRGEIRILNKSRLYEKLSGM